jgi:hypothetical protein
VLLATAASGVACLSKFGHRVSQSMGFDPEFLRMNMCNVTT